MKKILSVLLIAALLTFSMAGCGIKITIEKDDDTPGFFQSLKDKIGGLFGKEKDEQPGPVEYPEPVDDGPEDDGESYTIDYDEASKFFNLVFNNMTSIFCDGLLLDRAEIEDDNLAAVYKSYPAMAGLELVCWGLAGEPGAPSNMVDEGCTDYSNGYDGMVAAGICTAEDAKKLESGDMGDSFYAYYKIADLQPYIDYLFGKGRVDVSKWSNDASSDGYISYYITGTGYILYHTGIGDMTWMLSSVTNITLDGDKADVTYKRINVYPWEGEVYDGDDIAGYTEADIDSLYGMDVTDAYNEVLSKADFTEPKLTDHTITLFKDADGVHIYETFKG